MKRKLFYFLLFYFPFCTIYIPLSPSTIIKHLNFNALVESSDLIILGKTGESKIEWKAGNTQIWTYTGVKIQTLFKGKMNDSDIIQVVQQGGIDRVRNIAQEVVGTVTLEKDREVLLFLRRIRDYDYEIRGLSQGIFFVHKDNEKSTIIAPKTTATITGIKAESEIDQKIQSGPVSLDFFVQQLLFHIKEDQEK